MASSNITKSGTLFSEKQVGEVFNKVAGHSAIAKLSGQTPIPFAGIENYIFSMDGEASIVGEGENKPAGPAEFKKVSVKPVKVVYQHRLTDEFCYMSDEAKLPYLAQFQDGFAKKIARAIDIMYFHGLNPATKEAATAVKDIAFNAKVTQEQTFDAANADDNVNDAVNTIVAKDGTPTGIAMAPKFRTALGAIKEKTGSKVPMYPEFRGVGNPGTFMGLTCDINNSLAYNDKTAAGSKNTVAIVGDFQNALKWGYTKNIAMEKIEYGDPDGQGDLKRTNQIVLRAEAYIGCGIIDPESFVRIVETVPAAA